LLVDVNNLYVNQCNHGEDALAAIAAIAALPAGTVGELHLAGHLVTPAALIDHHGAPVADPVWALYEAALRAFGPTPALIEWDTEVPELAVLLGEVDKARALAARVPQHVHGTLTAVILPDWPAEPVELQQRQQDFADGLLGKGHIDSAVFAGDASAARQALYRSQQIAVWHSALGAAFPVLRQLLGDEFFEGLSHAFGTACPALDADLNQFGAALPAFLQDFAPALDYPYLPDMARLEWALHRARFSVDAAVITAADLALLSPSEFDDACFTLHPAVSLLASPYAVASLWHAHHGGAFPASMAVREQYVVARPQWQPVLEAVTPARLAFYKALGEGLAAGAAFDAALAIDGAFDLAGALSQALALGLLTAPPR
jgi:hypothetical protein